ncbi:hypothetical protein A6U86_00890 [Rhizobium sp. AC27/96]|uniref:hypothetical protein n=1 Tax=Rhizobium sp. AC27/96 TaxID=1841653 RepID=UPI00082769EB|nr:hypothetical protein [Rhizobium sp. AC27/96]OCJ11656.1 hypothetical protein A6U86_00890 [Rhizobium sp. AC27/96]
MCAQFLQEVTLIRAAIYSLIIFVGAIAAVILLVQFDFLAKSQFCKPDDPCIQQWFAALSGWVGAIATLTTLFLLREQILQSGKQHAQSIRAEYRDDIRLAERVMNRCILLQYRAEEMIRIKEKAAHGSTDMRSAYSDAQSAIKLLTLEFEKIDDLQAWDAKHMDGALYTLEPALDKLERLHTNFGGPGDILFGDPMYWGVSFNSFFTVALDVLSYARERQASAAELIKDLS